jgi:dihydroxyacetone kinase-like predicted kinase
MGAVCVEGGPTMNPSTADLVAAIERAAAPAVLVLPNSKNVIMAAEQAAASATKETRVVPTRTVQGGLGALVAFDPARPAAANEAEMAEAAAAVRAGAVARASRTATLGTVSVEEGQFLGLVDGEPVTAGPMLEPVARDVVERLLDGAADVLTVLLGEDADGAEELVEAVRTAHPGLEVEVHTGGQPHYPLLFSAE